MVAGEHAQAARVDRQGLGDRKFGAEVADARNVLQVRRAVQVLLEVAVPLDDAFGMLGETIGLIHRSFEGSHRVVRSSPGYRRQPLEQVERRRMPRPTQVIRKVFKERY